MTGLGELKMSWKPRIACLAISTKLSRGLGSLNVVGTLETSCALGCIRFREIQRTVPLGYLIYTILNLCLLVICSRVDGGICAHTTKLIVSILTTGIWPSCINTYHFYWHGSETYRSMTHIVEVHARIKYRCCFCCLLPALSSSLELYLCSYDWPTQDFKLECMIYEAKT